MLEAANDQPARLVLDLAAVDREAFMRTLALDNRAPDAAPPEGRSPTPKVRRQIARVPIRPLVVIDPGHGGIDYGTRSARSGEPEKSLVLDFCHILRDKIEKTGKYRVAMTRTDDTFVALADRVNFARARQASLFISIHADALARGEGDAQGATIYTLSETASDAAAARLAEAENRADVIAGLDLSAEPDDVADILIDLAAARDQDIFGAVRARPGRPDAQCRAAAQGAVEIRGLSRAPGARHSLRPGRARLCLEQARTCKSLTSEAWRGRTADAIVQAVDTFFTTRLAGSGRGAGRN